MRAYELTAYDGPGALRQVHRPAPTPGAGEVLVDVEAIGINFPDLLATRGQYQLKPDLPFVPGCEVAGTVRALGDDAAGLRVGDRVAAFVWQGGYAESVVVPAHSAFQVPDGVSSVVAAATIVNYHTTYFALARRGNLHRGETVLVLGAGGGIGTAAVQVARGLGAQVIAGVADDAQGAVAAEAGAHHVVPLEAGFSARVKAIAGSGVDVVLDPLGDWLTGEALRTLAPEGRLLVVGFAAGAIPEIKLNRLLLRNASAIGVAWGAFLDVEPEYSAVSGAAIAEMVAAGVVRPYIGARCSFDGIPDALERLGRGEIAGKGVVEL